MIYRAIWAMKESGMEEAPEAWQSAQYLYEFTHFMAQINPEDYSVEMPTKTGKNPTDLDEKVFLKQKTTIPAFESAIVHCSTQKTMMIGSNYTS